MSDYLDVNDFKFDKRIQDLLDEHDIELDLDLIERLKSNHNYIHEGL